MRRKIAVVLLILASGPVKAADTAGRYTYLGVGGNSCGKWTAQRKTSGAFAEIEWLLGYITAFNVFMPGGHISEGIDVEGLTAQVDNYCSANPLANLAVAAEHLIADLQARQNPPAKK